MDAASLSEFEHRQAQIERQIAALEARGGGGGGDAAASAGEDATAIPGTSDAEKAQYRIKMLLRALEDRDAAIARHEEALKKHEYRLLHLRRALDRPQPSSK